MFGMGTGVSPPLLSPGKLITILDCFCNTRYFLSKVRRRRCLASCRWIEGVSLSIDAPGNLITFSIRNDTGVVPYNNSKLFQNCTGIIKAKYLFSLRSRPRSISTGQLNASLHLHLRPIYHLVLVGPYFLIGMGELILRLASRLDAFSAYHVQT